ncbi:hypothetical protein BJX66DRAFT_193489 [Aspergillus keveii]|uniref:Uncharacterized protein n=1 Tax=Aspergillus keveii TaxID=714993 RepID=A0ABR4G6I7_9EURO
MWTITIVNSQSTIWCSDGQPTLNVVRGGPGESSPFIVDGKGFLDVTELNMRAPDPDSEYILIDADLYLTEVQIPSSPCGKPLTGSLALLPADDSRVSSATPGSEREGS